MLQRFDSGSITPCDTWKISDGDYSERELWPEYMEAYEDAIEGTSTKHAPWYVIPSNHKWFATWPYPSILADKLEDMDLKLPPANRGHSRNSPQVSCRGGAAGATRR